jgi:hypothetical protein
MRTWAYVLLAGTLLAGCTLRAAELSNWAGSPFRHDVPLVQFSETDFHFGYLAPAETVEHTFYVTNLSTRVVEIKDVRPGGPGAMLGGEWDRRIQPGQFGRIPIRLRMPGVPGTMPQWPSGTVVRAVTVSFDAPSNSSQFLLIRGTVWTPIAVKPDSVEFFLVEGENCLETNSVRIFNQIDQPITLDEPVCTTLGFRAVLKTITPGKEFELSVIGSNSCPGQVRSIVRSHPTHECDIRINTSNTNLPSFQIPVTRRITSLFRMEPSVVKLARQRRGRDFETASFTVFPQGKWPMHLEAIVNSETLHLDVIERPDRAFEIKAMFPTNLPPDKDLEFTMKTGHPGLPEFKVPINR